MFDLFFLCFLMIGFVCLMFFVVSLSFLVTRTLGDAEVLHFFNINHDDCKQKKMLSCG